MKRVVTLLLFTLFAFPLMAQQPPTSFNNAKKFLANLHVEIGHLETVYCGCPYTKSATTPGGVVDREACGLEARKNEKRSKRIEWEHIVPASWFGQTRACWILKDKAYPNQCSGKTGRKCCEAVNEDFDLAHNDPNNLFPSAGEVNGDRSNHPYGEVTGEPRVYGQCNAEIMSVEKGKVFEPAEGKVQGTAARAMLYMAQTYGVDVKLPLAIVWKWHNDNPPAAWEIERAEKIAERTGLRNDWILGPE